MNVDDYRFGKIVVDGTEYTQDLKVFPHEIEANWWRDEGHLLQVQDIQDVLDHEPRVLIVGQGAQGRMQISDEVTEVLDEHDIELVGEPTTKAVETFNDTPGDVVGAFHLTC